MNIEENPLSINEEYLAFIGSATTIWSGLDFTIQYLIWKLLKIDEEGDHGIAVTNNMMFREKITLAKTLANLWLEEGKLSARIHELLIDDLKTAKDLSEQRNKIMHGYFGITEEGEPYIEHVSTRGKVTSTLHFKNLDEFRYFINMVSCTLLNINQLTWTDWSGSPPEDRQGA